MDSFSRISYSGHRVESATVGTEVFSLAGVLSRTSGLAGVTFELGCLLDPWP